MHTEQVGPELQERLEALPQYLSQYSDIIAVYLFGSHASGATTPLSDIDIAYLLQEPDLDRELEIEAAITRAVGTDAADIQPLHKAPVPFQYRIITTGRLLYTTQDAARTDFEQQVIQTYAANQDSYEVDREQLLHAFR